MLPFASKLKGRKINLRHIKTKAGIIILINDVRAVTYMLHPIFVATGGNIF